MLTKRSLLLLSASTGLALAPLAQVVAQDAPIIQPGAPGKAAKQIKAEEAVQLAGSRFIQADVDFMQAMIPHHYQATQMTALIGERTSHPEILDIGAKIAASQSDEIAYMQGWLQERSKKVPDPAAHAAMGHSPAMMHDGMQGMATPQQMKALAASSGTDFDQMFLTLMIAHHKGALDMVDDLMDNQGAAYDPTLFRFVSEIQADQKSEIKQMNVLLTEVAGDPRSVLTAGVHDAGQAIKGLALVGSLPKPPGFFDPANPGGLKLPAVKDSPAGHKDGDGEGDKEDKNAAARKALVEALAALDDVDRSENGEGEGDSKTEFSERSPLLNFANTDMAFSGDKLVVGNYHGFNIYDIGGGKMPQLVSSIVCPGGQGDVSIVGDLLIMSAEQNRGRVDCGLQGISEDVSKDRFRGIRIFDIGDVTRPRQVGQVQTCRGSHTHSIVGEDDSSILVYNSGTGWVRDEDELAGCTYYGGGKNESALFSIDVIEIPKANPGAARIIDRPRVFADGDNIAGLWKGGDHGDGTQSTSDTDQCHDITIFPSKQIAAGACSGNGIILDISNPRAPKRIDDVTDKGFAYWHSATFNNDGTKVLFTDEWGGGGRPRCRSQDPREWGADAIYDITGGKLEQRSIFKLPPGQSDTENCVAHNGSLVPIPGRDIFVQAWYQGGISLIDFTDSSNPVEIAYFDRGPIDKDQLVLGGHWSVYWYNGRIYGTEIARGLDVLELAPSEHISANEVAAAKLASQGETFNPQQQYPVTWPDDPVVALALLDQLERQDGYDAPDGLRGALEAMRGGQSGDSAGLAQMAAKLGDGAKEQMLAQMLQRLS